MNNIKTCSLCLKAIYDDRFEVIVEITKQMLVALLVKTNLDEAESTVLCVECATKLKSVYDFKMSCLSAVNKLSSVDSKQDVKMELEKDISNGNSVEEVTSLSQDHKLCRFCRNVTESGSYTCMQEDKNNIFIIDMIQKYIPEIQLTVTEEVVTCKPCFDSLQTFLSFIVNCFDIGEEIEDIDETVFECESKLKKSPTYMSQYEDNHNNIHLSKIEDTFKENVDDVTIKDELEYYNPLGIDNVGMNIKTEELEIKPEQDEYESIRDVTTSTDLTSTLEHEIQNNSSRTATHSRDTCPSETEYEHPLTKHALIHEDPAETNVYKREKSSCETKPKFDLKKRTSNHQDLSYECERCPYKAVHKLHLTRHTLKHLGPSETPMYRCGSCSYETRYKSGLKNHALTHRDVSEVTVFKCASCPYLTKYKVHLKRHMSVHQVYRCDSCLFETKDRRDLSLHATSRHAQSEIPLQCATCAFVAKNKEGLKSHMLRHRDSSEVRMYRCKNCAFETKYRANLAHHMLVHENPSEVATYRCACCPYVAKRKNNLKTHMRIHSGVAMYKCELCLYETKWKNCLIRHILVHKDPSELRMIKCEKCSYMTKFKCDLTDHMLTH